MATKKPTSRAKAKPAPTRLQNLAARSNQLDDTLGEDLADHSGVFRVTSQIAQAQSGHDEGPMPRFASDSLTMAAQRGAVLDDAAIAEDEASAAVKRQRMATLAARVARTRRPR
jgi:hypothetical protein